MTQLRDALLSAYPSHQDLEMMVAYGLNENLSAIAPESNLEQKVFKLIQWSRAKGRLEELVQAAISQNSRNPQLTRVVEQLRLNDQRRTPFPQRRNRAEYIGQWLPLCILEMIFHYSRHYRQYLVQEHQWLDVKGLSTRTAHDLELEQVFVDLCINPTPLHQASSDPLHSPQPLQERHSIWDHLSNTKLANKHLIVLGAPGSGKTTLLRHLALTLAQPRKYPQQQGVRHTFPLLLFLREHSQAIMNQPKFSLAKAVQNHIQDTFGRSLPPLWMNDYLKRGMCLILLDGLDEVADTSTRERVIRWVQQQIRAYPDNRFVLTSRPYGYHDNQLNEVGVTVLEVQTFTWDQVKQFVQNWYLAEKIKECGEDSHSTRSGARKGAGDLMQRLEETPDLQALAVNPLLLTMIATIHYTRGSLPEKRIRLYSEMCEVFLSKWREAHHIPQYLTSAQQQQVLSLLAYIMMKQRMWEIKSKAAEFIVAPALEQMKIQIAPARFLPSTEENSGLLLNRGDGSCYFAHPTFQEYLAAVYVKEKGLEQELVAQVANEQWHETIRLYCAQSDATPIIEACLQDTTTETLLLALQCQREAFCIEQATQHRLQSVIDQGIEDADPERRRITAEVWLYQRLRQMYPLDEQTFIDTSPVTNAEYQLFLDEQRQQGRYHRPDHWRRYQFPKGEGKAPILGIRRSDAQAFCHWLSQRESGTWHYRLPRTMEIEQRDPRIWKDLSAQMGYWVEDKQRFTWSQMQPPSFGYMHIPQVLDLDDLGLVLNRAHALDLDYALDLDHARAINPDLAHALDIDLVLAHAHALDRRTRALGFDIYHQLFILQERRTGRLPAYECILLVKERRKIYDEEKKNRYFSV